MAYPSIKSHFEIQKWNWSAAIVGLHIVYGWMPTIPDLKNSMVFSLAKQKKLIAILEQAKIGRLPDNSELKLLCDFSNNSIVGASKFLHFVEPNVFPIWDSQVAKVFLQRTAYHQQTNKIGHWKNYQAELTRWLGYTNVKRQCSRLRKLKPDQSDISSPSF